MAEGVLSEEGWGIGTTLSKPIKYQYYLMFRATASKKRPFRVEACGFWFSVRSSSLILLLTLPGCFVQESDPPLISKRETACGQFLREY